MCLSDCTTYDSATQNLIKNPGCDGNCVSDPFNEKWDNGVVPYQVECGMNNFELSRIANAVQEFQKKTGIHFEHYNEKLHSNWVIFSDTQMRIKPILMLEERKMLDGRESTWMPTIGFLVTTEQDQPSTRSCTPLVGFILKVAQTGTDGLLSMIKISSPT